ncbi:outer membrane beta-barrel protein [Pedobacter antarcticus]|uniref:Outer membrane protein beta-barrel domain-containing protein n=2 Tax=Pedobacter antarcticus TaxID=34086 RepID=A0A081PIH7_9SPHI|nr:outer membrane beta-barrel protein [Pedobacter antarcticus]KEQ30500.1 hypothetical protein N180_09380 [Pedobacter antarcticus 4BY]SDM79670.1 Outer membrane protein beta-barrel domain-containing protein [Pedobacter antarcticus]SFF37415.1 Outer membrane protein beta-barrel domain-containing protein [Pedobacter antarcticus]
MKRFLMNLLVLSSLTALSSGQLLAQDENSLTFSKNKKYNINLSFGDSNDQTNVDQDSTKVVKAHKGRFLGGVTFTRLDIGFSRIIDNGSFSVSPKNDFLSYKGAKTSTISFDVLYFGYRFNPNFKVYVAGGFDWTMIRLKNDVTIQQNMPELVAIDDDVHFSKNRLSNSYVHIPLNFEFRSKENNKGKRFYLVLGPEVSFLLNGKVKQISDERGKQKFKDDYHFQPVRVGGTARIGYGGIGLFTKYYFNDMFDTDAQKGVKNMSFGITFGLN